MSASPKHAVLTLADVDKINELTMLAHDAVAATASALHCTATSEEGLSEPAYRGFGNLLEHACSQINAIKAVLDQAEQFRGAQ